MKNLVTMNRGNLAPESLTYPDLPVADVLFEPETDLLTVALANDEYVEVQRFAKSGDVAILVGFPLNERSRLISFNHFAEMGQIVFAFDNGDLIIATYGEVGDWEAAHVEIVGLIDAGLESAEWLPDNELLVIVSRDHHVLVLPRLVDDPICDHQLQASDINISDLKHVSVGWGHKETQFKGRGAKQREREALRHAGLGDSGPLRDPTVNEVERGVLLLFDSNATNISWRGDCQFFAISTVETVTVADTGDAYPRRVIRVFSRDGELDSVNEAVDGLEHNLAWRPLGALIALTQRGLDADGDEAFQVVFYERNGLRHGEFNLRMDPELALVDGLSWSCTLEVLAVQTSEEIQLWTTNNYHWYLKQTYPISEKVLCVKWHPEKPLHLCVVTASLISIIDLTTKIVTGPTVMGANDIGMTVVTDGCDAKITPLSRAMVPPPISLREVTFPGQLMDVTTSGDNKRFAAIGSDQLWVTAPQADPMDPLLPVDVTVDLPQGFAKQLAFIGEKCLVVAIDSAITTALWFYDSVLGEVVDNIELETKAVLLTPAADFSWLAVELRDGQVLRVGSDASLRHLTQFPQLCNQLVAVDELAIGILATGKLFVGDHEVCNNATLVQVTELHLMFTTSQSQLCFVHLAHAQEFNANFGQMDDERVRQIERGSFIVNAVPSKYTVVLEATRGNLELICPRIMVLSAVRKFIENLQYRDAFLACRTHRIDLDILHDFDPKLFMANVEKFVNQIEKVEYLDLFVSCLHEEDVAKTKYRETKDDTNGEAVQKEPILPQAPLPGVEIEGRGLKRIIRHEQEVERDTHSKINRICGAILKVLTQPAYQSTYLQTVVTAYACQKPPSLKEALGLIATLSSADEQELAITHLCFLQDVNKLYQTALSIYNVKMALMIAQHSQMDPKEYLPFLQNVHSQSELQRKFLIDDYLKNYEKALGWLHEQKLEDFDDYMVDHQLYREALSVYSREDNQERLKQVYKLFGAHLHDEKNYDDAALTFEYLSLDDEALSNYLLAKRWPEALTLVATDREKYTKVASELVELLEGDHRYLEAAEIEHHVLGNMEAAVTLYCKNYHFDRAIFAAVSSNQQELVELTVDPQLGECFGVIAELLADCRSQMLSQVRRIRELRTKKQEDPFAFYGMPEQDTPDNVLIAPLETLTAPSFFTRYTGKTLGTAKTGASRRTAKNRKREERKRAKGRKGTIYEEEYLIRSVGRLIERLNQQQPDAVRLLEGLLRRQKREQALQIQRNWLELLDYIREHLEEIHAMSDRDRERLDDDGNVYLMDPIVAPTVPSFPVKAMLDY